MSLRKLMEAAMPRPWAFRDEERQHINGWSTDVDIVSGDEIVMMDMGSYGADARLIVAAVNLLPELLAVVDAAEIYQRHVDDPVADCGESVSFAQDELESALATYRRREQEECGA